jgi:threonine/homoserine/homoserine lactone efflux protein
MDWYVIASFLISTLLLLITPGPVMAIVGHNTLRYGLTAGLLTVLGVELGEVCLLGATFAGLLISSEFLPQLFRWLSLAGALYLVWLALAALRSRHAALRARSGAGSPRPLVAGITVAFGNPTAIIFYAAFFPQFLDPARAISGQVLELGAIYLATSLIFDLASVLAFANLWRPAGLRRFAGHADLASAAVYVTIAIATAISFVNASG